MLVFTFHRVPHGAAGDTWVWPWPAVSALRPARRRHRSSRSAPTRTSRPTAQEVEDLARLGQWITDKWGLKKANLATTGWVNQNWLTHVIFYKLTTSLGSETDPYYDALVLWKFAIYILAAAALYGTSRIYGVNRALAAMFVCFVMFIGRSFLDIRPAGFSNLLTRSSPDPCPFQLPEFDSTSADCAADVFCERPRRVHLYVIILAVIGWHGQNLPRR